jgi:2OG-Fe(II) oxygenase superfamily
MPIESAWPRAHLVADDFFAPSALATIFRELRSLDRLLKPGLVRDIGHDGQSVFFEHERRRNKAVWIHEPSKTLRLFREQLWSEPMLQSYEQAREPLFQIIPSCWAPHLQVSSYMTGDHYAFHEDEGAGVNLTAIVFLATEPKKVRGGDLVLAYDGDETTIPFRNNRLLIFPSKTPHRVTPVRVASTDRRHARVSLQCWLTYGRLEAKPRRRAPEADRPTFLLAEESILAAAQVLGDDAAATDQTPEDLYWGAFYLSRILTSNLRCVAAEQADLELGKILIRRRGELEIYGRGRFGGTSVRVGFVLGRPKVGPAEALSIFVETGRGASKSITRRLVPAGAGERETAALLRRLLARAVR